MTIAPSTVQTQAPAETQGSRPALLLQPALRLSPEQFALELKAYGWSKNDNLLSNLLDLNLELAEPEAAGEVVVGPWAPV